MNASSHSTFSMQCIPVRIYRSISRVISALRELKTLTSRGCLKCEECMGNKARWMRLRMQWRMILGVVWLPCPSKMSSHARPFARSVVLGSKFSRNHFFACSLLVQPSVLHKKNQSAGVFFEIHRPDKVLPLK